MSIWFIASGLMAPLWAVIGFIAVWVILVVLACVWIRRHPWRVVLLPMRTALSPCSAACARVRCCSAGPLTPSRCLRYTTPVRDDVGHGYQLYDSRGLQIVTDRPLA